ncbi:hypothetical protein JW813_05035 [Clostridium botulinum]|nr:hypothetical protein [Clostridium botulinum]UZP04374.1 hypothetical protein JW813_05035 [Clostridium botulinum]UZP07732.1 hypothetical protein JYA71_05030 [Clostridium botulinum]UZP07786.1 hypothetical protein JYA71_05310 [Clostridium botulinum]UZP11113.1 hypothetical protein JYA74_05030 [Clostridium botulinum]
MKIEYLGQLVSLIYCKKCGTPIEIGVTQEQIICPNCKKIISLNYDLEKS